MVTIFANNMQWGSEILNSHTIANSKFMFVEANTHARPKYQPPQIWALMLLMRDIISQEQVV